MAEKRLFKEYKQLLKVHPRETNHQIVSIVPKDPEDNIFEWTATICKPSRDDSPYYYNGQWTLDITVSDQYPMKPPVIRFSKLTPINHPNINIDTGEICLDILKSENWSPAWNLINLVVAVLLLLDDPEPDSPLNIDLANLFRADKEAFESLAQFTIWKHDTFCDKVKDAQGVKEIALKQDKTNVSIIQDVGKQVAEDFISKVDEIKHSKESSIDTDIDVNYKTAKKKIVEDVNRQVQELCSKSVSPPGEGSKRKVLDPVVEDEKKKFLKEVDNKINEYQKRSQSALPETLPETSPKVPHLPKALPEVAPAAPEAPTAPAAPAAPEASAAPTVPEASAAPTVPEVPEAHVDLIPTDSDSTVQTVASTASGSTFGKLKKSRSVKGKKSKRDRLKDLVKKAT